VGEPQADIIHEQRRRRRRKNTITITTKDILYNRTKQKKGEIHESHNKVYNESLRTDRNIAMGLESYIDYTS
jgi:hypothetical protein